MKKDVLLIWDFDDTIVETNIEFESTNKKTAGIIGNEVYGTDKHLDAIMAYQRKLDVEMVGKFGFVPPRYLMSWIATYENLCTKEEKPVSNEVKTQIQKTVEDLYVRKFKNFPTSLPVIEYLHHAGYPMIILTAGQDEIQRRKVDESGAGRYMESIHVYSKKTPETLKEVMAKYQAREYVMIGNSLKSDIHPALENNIWGFHFERATWEADHYDVDKNHLKYVHVSAHTEIPVHLERIRLSDVAV